ncbi:MAG: T9SS type A sorting domain-containing protein [Flavobacteriales bacterium]|nr:T9SS type A sorting domain-containing protein [Flavobacteriales bacterium]
MRTALLLTSLALATMANAQVFTSGFENWPDTVPADWMGVKTNISADSVEQVTENPHSGSFAVRLYNQPTSTKRFTTQPVQVDSAQSYVVTFWVRGQGDIRASMFDGRTENNGYSPNTAYIVVNSSEWTQQTTTLICDHTTPAGEFIMYVRNTAAPDRLVVDDVNIELGGIVEPVAASIYQIQSSVDGNGASTYADQPVITGGIVTGVDTIGANSYFIQAGTGPWSGIYCFDGSNSVNIGDSVVLQATVVEFNGVTELSNVVTFSVVGQYPTPAPQLLDTYLATLEQWEGVLAVLANVQCTTLPDGFGEWAINAPQGAYIVDDLMYAYSPSVGANYDVTGCVHYANGAWKIEPRFAADIAIATSVDELAFGGVEVFPNPAAAELNIRLAKLTSTTDYLLQDLSGRVVRSGNMTSTVATLDLTGLAEGSYVLVLRNANGLRTMKVQH